MGEDAELIEEDGAAYVKHNGCPWYDWHQRSGLLAEDRPGCDVWFETTVKVVNEKLGTNLKVETLKALPDGDDCCLRKFTE